MAGIVAAIALTLFACAGGPRAPRASAFELDSARAPAPAGPSGALGADSRAVEVAAPTGFFDLDLDGVDQVAFVIDRALGGELEIVKAELAAAVASLPDGVEVGVVFFGDGELASRGPLRLDATARRRIDGLIRGAELAAIPDSPAAALKRAYTMDPRRVILVAARLDRADGRALLGEIRPGVRIDTVGIGGAGDLLVALAGASGGDAIER